MDNLLMFCKKCNGYFEKDHFVVSMNSKKKGSSLYYCKEKDSRAKNMFILQNKPIKPPKKQKSKYYENSRLKLYYGITTDDYDEMYNTQNGCCAICGRHQHALNQKLFVDHCHKTGIVRGLLCNICNTGLGMFKDNPKFLQEAIVYLNKIIK